MSATMKTTLKYDPEKRAEFEAAVREFVSNVEQLFGWKSRQVTLENGRPLCLLEWELGSVADLAKGADFEENEPNKPGWWTSMNDYVLGERIEVVDGEQVSCLRDTLV